MELVRLLEERQEELILELCGPKYSRSHPYKRGGSRIKTVVTSLGTVRFKLKRVIRRTDNKTSSPILDALDVNRRKYTRDVRMKLAEFASVMSYRDACKAPLLEANKTADELGAVLGDSTEVRGLESREMNNVHILLSDGGQLLHLGVNSDWPNVEADTLISDNEPGLINAVKAERRQLGILHALKYLLFTLWGEGMRKDERVEVDKAAKQALFTLVNSTKKHRKDRDKERLKARIDNTLRELHDIADELGEQGYTKASSFIIRNARFMVTFAQLTLEDVEIPYTTNKIERLMGEISKRCKHKWMHWSTEGLRNILTIVLLRYTNEQLYNQFKNAYIHNGPFTKTGTAQKANL